MVVSKFSRAASVGSSREIKVTFRVAPVRRMLLAMSEMVDQGMRVVFGAEGGEGKSQIEVKSTGEKIPLVRRRRVYVMDMGIRGSGIAKVASSRGFPRQGARL